MAHRIPGEDFTQIEEATEGVNGRVGTYILVGDIAKGLFTAVELSNAERDELLKFGHQRERDRVQRKPRNSPTVIPMSLAIWRRSGGAISRPL
jgi:hypothetical protein